MAIALSPNSALVHLNLGDLLDALGRLEEGWTEHEIAQQLDRGNNILLVPHFSHSLYLRGQYDHAIELLTRTAKGSPNDPELEWFLSEAYMQKGMHPESVQELGKTLRLLGFPEIAPRLHRAFATSGWRGALLQLAKEVEQLIAIKRGYFPGCLALVYAQLGDKDRAFYWLEQGRTHPATDDSMYWVKVDPLFAPLRSDPRFNDFLRGVGLLP